MSRNKPNLGEPYQIYTEVTDAGKNISGSKKKVRWLFGFTEREGEVEVALIHSIVSGKKTIFEDGKEIVSSTNRLATDFGHTWRSETCPGKLFRIEFSTSMTTDPTVYTFTVDGGKFADMPKKSSIGGGGNYSGSSSNNRNSISGFGSTSASHAGSNARSSFNANSAAKTGSGGNTSSGFGKTTNAAPQPTTSTTNRRYIYGDDESDDESSHSKPAAAPIPAPTPAQAPRGNFQSPFSTTNTTSNAGFGFDPFAEAPAPAPAAAKPSAATSLFNAFDDAPPAATATNKQSSFDPFGDSNDPFGASDPFSSPAPASNQQQQRRAEPVRASFTAPAPAAQKTPVQATPAAAAPAAPKPVPNFFDDDFAPAATPPAAPVNSDFGNAFPSSVHTTPVRRSSAIEISQDFAGLSFAAPAPVASQPSPAMTLFAATEPEPASAPKPEPVISNDPWSSNSNLVNLDLSGGSSATKRPSFTEKGVPMNSMMHSSPAPSVAGNGLGSARPSFTSNSPDTMMMMNSNNTRGSFVAGASQMGAGGMGAGGMGAGGMNNNNNSRASFTGGLPMGVMAPTASTNPNASMGGMGMGTAAPMGGMGGMGNMNAPNSRASFTAGPGAMPAGGNLMGGMPAGGNMGGNNMGGMSNNHAMGAPASKRSSLDDLDWKF